MPKEAYKLKRVEVVELEKGQLISGKFCHIYSCLHGYEFGAGMAVVMYTDASYAFPYHSATAYCSVNRQD